MALPSFASMFAGIGGFDLALTRTGWTCKWANEKDKYACQVYRKNFGSGELVEGDIREIQTENIPDVDLLVGGFLCQSFSLAGKREGFRDIRGTLFFEIARVARAKKPSLLLLENVKGLLSNDYGKTFGTILEELGNIGYWCEWQVLNSKYFGVPQNRERVFIIGHLRDRGTRQIFPIGTVNECSDSTCKKTEEQGKQLRANSAQCANTLTARYYKDGSENLILQQHHREGGLGVGKFRIFKNTVPTLTGLMGTGGNNVPMVLASDKLPICCHRIRKLTPRECERLQGFPDDWTKLGTTREGEIVHISDTQRYKMLGNAVTVNVVQYLGSLLIKTLGELQIE